MNYATLDDLKQLFVVSFDGFKQFVETTVGQSEARLEAKMSAGFAAADTKIEALRDEMHAGFEAANNKTEALRDDMDADFTTVNTKINGLQKQMDEGFAGLGDAFSQLNGHIDKKNRQTSKRLARLEAHPA